MPVAGIAVIVTMLVIAMVMRATGFRIILQRTGQQCQNLTVGLSASTRIQGDSRFGQSVSSSSADPAADQGVHALIL